MTFQSMGGYLYVADGKVYVSDWGGTVGELKKREGFKEVRRCPFRRFNEVGSCR